MLQLLRTFTLTGLLLAALTGRTVADTFIVENGLFFLGAADVVEDVLILNGGVLLLDGATVTGDIEIEEGGALAASRATIGGEVEADRALLVDLGNCDIYGDVTLKRTGGSGTVFGLLPSITVFNCDIYGNLKITRSDVNSISVRNNIIDGKLELTRNRSVLPIVVENNTVRRRNKCD